MTENKTVNKDLEVRLLPSDYKEYKSLGNKKKRLAKPKGFFVLPEKLKTKERLYLRPFLVFYFDSDTDYNLAKSIFELPSRGTSHPVLNTNLLMAMIDEYYN